MFYHITIHAFYPDKSSNPSESRTHSCLTWREMVCELYRQYRVMSDLFAEDTGARAIVSIHEALGGSGVGAGALVEDFHTWSQTDAHRVEAMLDDLITFEHQALKDAVARDGKPSMQELYEAGALLCDIEDVAEGVEP